MSKSNNHTALLQSMIDALDEQGNAKNPQWVVLPATLTPAMAEEIRMDDRFTHKALQARFDALVKAAPKDSNMRPIPESLWAKSQAAHQQDQTFLSQLQDIGERLLEGHKQDAVDWSAFRELEAVLAELNETNRQRA